MNRNVLNGVTKLVNSVLWAVLVKLLLTVGLEIWSMYQNIPETTRSLDIWGNVVVVMVFLIAVTTYRFPQQLEIKMPTQVPMPTGEFKGGAITEPPVVEEPDTTQFDELLKSEKKEPKLDDDLEKIRLGLQ